MKQDRDLSEKRITHSCYPCCLWGLLALSLCVFLLGGCGLQTCDFCGKNKFCKEFDILGVTRHICQECLNDPSIALSGNMVRTYSEKYEDGTLEYPEGSPLRPEEEKPKNDPGNNPGDAPGQNKEALPTLTEDVHTDAPADQSTIPENAPANEQPVPENIIPDNTAQPAEQSNVSLSGSGLITALNDSLANDGLQLVPVNDEGKEYNLYSGNTDLGIHVTVSQSGNAEMDGLVIGQSSSASSSDYVKAVIRSILPYVGSRDYDGLGHDIYNQTIQNGSFKYQGITFRSVVHTSSEIEKGSPVTDFSILP